MPPVYTLDGSIAEFFQPLQGVTRQLCDDKAVILVGLPINPCPIQGQFSYAVYAGPDQAKVVQFRSEHLDEETLKLTYSIFGRFVAKTIRYGYIGNPSKLEVFEVERIPGVTLIETQMKSFSQTSISADPQTWRNNIVADFARFFAFSWKCPIDLEEQRLAACRKVITQKLMLLSESLPSRFAKTMLRLSNAVDGLFYPSYPLTLTHSDLCEMNIIVDPETGHIKGIIDWIDAKIQPFGLALWGLQNVLGYMNEEGWHYFDQHEQLEKMFWETFEKELGAETITKELREKIR